MFNIRKCYVAGHSAKCRNLAIVILRRTVVGRTHDAHKISYQYIPSLYVTIVVVLTLTRIIKSVVTGQAPVTLEQRNTPEKKHKPKVVHAYITADAIRAATRNI